MRLLRVVMQVLQYSFEPASFGGDDASLEPEGMIQMVEGFEWLPEEFLHILQHEHPAVASVALGRDLGVCVCVWMSAASTTRFPVRYPPLRA